MQRYFGILVLALFGCGSPSNLVHLKVQLPASLAKGTPRYQRFLGRADRLSVLVISEGGEQLWTGSFAPRHWDGISVPGFDLPSKNGPLTVTIGIWDRTKSGEARPFPVLKGEKKLDGKAPQGETFTIRLALQVGAAEYD